VNRVAVATDGSPTAARAVDWAADMARRYGAELLLVRVVPDGVDLNDVQVDLDRAAAAAGDGGRGRVVAADDPAGAIVRVATEERADVLVVGNVAMRGRKEFLLGNVPNRVSHAADCCVVIVNTAGEPEAPAAGRAPAAGGDPELIRRAFHIARVLHRRGALAALRGRGPAVSTPEGARRVREALEELGPTFAKLGQILSTRPDLVPIALADELASLQDRVTPLTEAEVVGVMEAELKVPWEDVFDSIEPAPLAAGTIGQVHRARLADGERVVVKVQRPRAEGEIMQDVGLLELVAERARGRRRLRRVVDLPAIVDHLSASLRRELDFRVEAANLEQMRELLARYDRLAVPALHPQFTTARLLVMEEVQGVPIRDAPPGEARTDAARQLLESFYRQILLDGFFHADPHPGNLMWCRDRVYFLDLGMVGEVEADVRGLMLLILLAFAEGDAPFLAEATLMLAGEVPGGADADVDRDRLGADLAALLRRQREGGTLDAVRLGPIVQEMTEISLRHGVPLPASMALTGKALAQVQLAAAALDPELDPFAVAGRFVVSAFGEALRRQTDPRHLVYEAQKARLRFVRLAEAVERAAGARPGGNIRVDFVGTENLVAAINRTGRWLGLGFMAAGALVALTLRGSRRP
jgi:ubiquinone biosynthesis protein